MALFTLLSLPLISAATADQSFIQPQIVGGIIASPGLFTYMATLHAERINNIGIKWSTFCGSSLISDEFVLTAAHCVVDSTIINVKLTFGTTNASMDADEADRLVIDVPKENIIVYEGYDPKRSLNDIALVKLPRKITFSRMIQPLRLPTRSQPNLDGDVAVVTGWGSMGSLDQTDQNKLRYAQLRIFPDENCKQFFRSYYHDSNICLDGSSQSPCYGDSGGPAVVVDRQDRLFTLVGVASYVSHRGCEKGDPVGYARVTSFLDWIHQHTDIPIKD
uniref:Venom polypeptide n=1 Tax=Dolopus genitalis TaxID=2488630 RepID=A0A3G5BII5_DOLGE|nr:venom polypeptide [Dolopus genitalis]